MIAHIPKISIIIPIYNADKYLQRCIDSLLNQSFRDFELLLIDDGSPDRSGEICELYAKQDSRVRVFHKENGGVSVARQFGIEKALGEYSIYVDPDDWVEFNMLEDLYNSAKDTDADMVICDYYIDLPQKSMIKRQPVKSTNSKELLIQLFESELMGAMWNKLIKRSLYVQYNVRFPSGVDFCEDYCVIVQFLLHNLKITYLSHAYYHYNQIDNNQSITRNINHLYLRRVMSFISELEHLICFLPDKDKYLSLKKEEFLIKVAISRVIPFSDIIELYPDMKNKSSFSVGLANKFRLFLIKKKLKNCYYVAEYVFSIIRNLYHILPHAYFC